MQGSDRDGPPGTPVDADELARHTPHLESFTMRDLYVRPYREFTPEERGAIQFCKKNGVFSPPSGAEIADAAQKCGNNWKCNSNTLKCFRLPNYFRSEDFHGNCSTMSG